MWDGYAGGQIRRANLRLLLANVALFAVAVLMLSSGWPQMQAWMHGPTPVPADQVASLGGEGRPVPALITFDVPEVLSTGYQEVETDDGKQTGVKADYGAVWAGKRLLLIKSKPGKAGTHVVGELRAAPDDVVAGVRGDLPEDKRDILMPIMIDQTRYASSRSTVLFLIVVCAALATINLVRWSRRAREFASHPIAKRAGGEAVLQSQGLQLDQEMATFARRFGPARLTPHWIAMPTTFGTHLARLEDVVWVHRQVTQHRVWYVVPAGKSHAVAFYTRGGHSFVVPCKEKQADELANLVATRAPWVVAGYSDELANLWRKDRTSFVGEVDRRRQAA